MLLWMRINDVRQRMILDDRIINGFLRLLVDTSFVFFIVTGHVNQMLMIVESMGWYER
jgi:hypothetical protein